MAEYSRVARGVGQFTQERFQSIYTPFVPDFVKIWNPFAYTTTAVQAFPTAMWNKFMAPYDGIATTTIVSGPSVATTNLYPVGIAPIVKGEALILEAPVQVVSVSTANPAVVTYAGSDLFYTGDVVMFEGLPGMPQLSGMMFEVTFVGQHSFSINWNTNQSGYTAVSGTPPGAVITKVSNPFLYSPGVNYISAITQGPTTAISTTTQHNMLIGQEVAFRIPPQWGMVNLNSTRNRSIPNSPLYAVVIQVVDNFNLVVDINSTNFLPFTTNVPATSFSGLSFPQMIAVGDVNMGSNPITTNSQLYPSPAINVPLLPGYSLSSVNGPAIQGAFFNNSAMGFVFGQSFLTNPSGGSFLWEARIHDYSMGYQLAPF